MARAHCPGKVHFPGFVNTSLLPDYYGAADFLVHPSVRRPTSPGYERGSLLRPPPAVVSDRVGSVGESDDRWARPLLEYPFGDVEALSAAESFGSRQAPTIEL